MRAQKVGVREQFKMAAGALRALLRGWRTGVQPGYELRQLVRKLCLELGAEVLGVRLTVVPCNPKNYVPVWGLSFPV